MKKIKKDYTKKLVKDIKIILKKRKKKSDRMRNNYEKKLWEIFVLKKNQLRI